MGSGVSTEVSQTAQEEIATLSKPVQEELEEKRKKVEEKEKELQAKLEEQRKELQAKLDEKDKELDQLRAAAAAPPPTSPTKAALSDADAAAVAKIEEQAKREDEAARCEFYCLDAKQLMDSPFEAMPKYQDLERDHPAMLVPFDISFVEACEGKHVGKVLTVSHRWMSPTVADIDGVQLAAIRKHLAAHPKIELVWIDYSCMPQGEEKTPIQLAHLKRMLRQINLLYLGTSVLILLDLSYISRFWTQYEAWLSMQQASDGKLRRAYGYERRETIVPIYNGTETAAKLLEQTWANVSPEEAMVVLAKPDVTVTNASDKTTQIERLKVFSANVQKVASGLFKIVQGIERAVGRKPAGRTWRDEWPDMWMERYTLVGESFPRSDFEPGGSGSIEAMMKQVAAPVQWMVDQGWPREQAEAAQLISAFVNAPLAASVRDRSDRYAASAHAVFEAMSGAAQRLTAPAPLLYMNLTGMFGLATIDPAYQALLQPGVAPGVQLFTNGIGSGEPANDNSFPDESGYRLYTSVGWQEVDSDIVCFRSAPADADGLHTLIPWSSGGMCRLPPMATVTLEKIDEPGEWEANGKRVKRRLYTVSVSYRV